ncbi:hypothetical protein L226DRAFT_319951 [Lentinus tigrinus ALCF2SS1-7]|uniref:uncharacterized protein n=1 Tax=Lentinus tigrinus ALCF2SS1-7 TaxID=1328758 RepID=UPI001165D6E8|nr:hypothetical protein L226DRAFT_319951 [Lentinus tigrinus ALCF2SS1-7]
MSASTLSLHAVSPWSEPRNGRDKPGPSHNLPFMVYLTMIAVRITYLMPSVHLVRHHSLLRALFECSMLVFNLWDVLAIGHLRHRAWPWPPSPPPLDETYAPLSASGGCILSSYTVTLEMRGCLSFNAHHGDTNFFAFMGPIDV